MPCWEVNTVTLEFKAKNIDLMVDVLQEMGLRPRVNSDRTRIETMIGSFNLKTGKVEVNDYNEGSVNKFRIKYSEKVLDVASKKFGWKLKNGKKSATNVKRAFVAKKW